MTTATQERVDEQEQEQVEEQVRRYIGFTAAGEAEVRGFLMPMVRAATRGAGAEG